MRAHGRGPGAWRVKPWLAAVAASVLCAVAVLQLVLAVFAGGSNVRLRGFGHSVGRYLAQVASFESFASEELPFPFADWPAGD